MQVDIARIGKPHGIRGEVTVQVLTDDPESRFSPGSVLAVRNSSQHSELTVISARWNKNILLLAFEEVEDRTQAESLRGAFLTVNPEEEGEAAEEDEYYEHELKGLAVVENGQQIGTVEGLVTNSAQDLLQAQIRGSRVLIPFVRQIVTEVDVAGGKVVVELPAGLLELGEQQ